MKILVVDDEYLIRYAIAAIFKDDQSTVTTTASGAETLAAIGKESFDLCFLDIHLPDMNGFDIMKKLREVSPPTRIIVMTGSEVSGAMMRTIRDHAHAFITKPFDLFDTKRFINQIFMLGRPLQQEERKSLKEYGAFLKWFSDDERKHERRPAARSITCSSIGQSGARCDGVSLSADVLDISDNGMCIRTDRQLEPGHVLQVRNVAEQLTGVVRWSARDGGMPVYRMGIQFITPGAAQASAHP